MRLHDAPVALKSELKIALDLALPECFWKRRFFDKWRDYGLDVAFEDWTRGPIKNPEFVPKVQRIIEEIKQWPYRP
jgi:hypothetical protein